jgi:hypothetical protein
VHVSLMQSANCFRARHRNVLKVDTYSELLCKCLFILNKYVIYLFILWMKSHFMQMYALVVGHPTDVARTGAAAQPQSHYICSVHYT